MKLRTITSIEGFAHVGKTEELVKRYRETVKTNSAVIISFEENLSRRIPLEEINAIGGLVDAKGFKFSCTQDFVVKINKFVKERNINHLFLDSLSLSGLHPMRVDETYNILRLLKTNVTYTVQIKRDEYASNS